MKRKNITSQRLILILIGGCLLLNYPLLSIFSRSQLMAGIPLLFFYVFATWLLLILLTALVLRKGK